MRQAEEKAAQAGITDESLPREGCLTWKMAADRHLNYAWGVTCKHAAQKAGLRRYGKRARWAPQRKAPCRITAIAACGLIYTTPLGPVKLDDLKDQFEKYLSAAGINGGTIPSDTEVKVASRASKSLTPARTSTSGSPTRTRTSTAGHGTRRFKTESSFCNRNSVADSRNDAVQWHEPRQQRPGEETVGGAVDMNGEAKKLGVVQLVFA